MKKETTSPETSYRAVAEDVLTLGDSEIPCAVLNDKNETAVLSMRGLSTALGVPWRGRREKTGHPSFLGLKGLEPFIGADLLQILNSPLPYTTTRGVKALGYSAPVLKMICQVWLDARRAGVLTESHLKTADTAELLMSGFAGTGIVALVYEACGYKSPSEGKLAEVFNRILEKDYHDWAREFPLRYYELIYMVYNREEEWRSLLLTAKPAHKPQTPSWLGGFTRDAIYARLQPPGLLQMIELRNPANNRGHRKRKHHQHLTPETGLQLLREHRAQVILLMEMAVRKPMDERRQHLRNQLDCYCPIPTNQMHLALDVEGAEKKLSIAEDAHPSLFKD